MQHRREIGFFSIIAIRRVRMTRSRAKGDPPSTLLGNVPEEGFQRLIGNSTPHLRKIDATSRLFNKRYEGSRSNPFSTPFYLLTCERLALVRARNRMISDF